MEDQTLNNTASLNMKVVVKETGIKPDTLRAWERRYGLPAPVRTPGGHRLYSQRDVETVKWLKSRQQEGLSISRAVELWKQLQRDGEDPLLVMPLAPPERSLVQATGATIEGIRRDWIAACRNFDEPLADQILIRAFAIYPPDQVCTQVLMKGLAEIGIGWYEGEVTVQQEHMASELAIRRLESLVASSPPPTLPGKVLLLCPPSEEHTFSPLLLTYLLRRNGRQAIFLGANVPVARIDETILQFNPDLVIMTAQQLHTAANLLNLTNTISEHSVPVAFGGRIFNMLPELRDRIPGTFLGEDLEAAPDIVTRILNNPILLKQSQELSDNYQIMLDAFQSHLSPIEAAASERMRNTEISPSLLSIANLNLGQSIIAALRLGDISFLETDIDWIKTLLANLDFNSEGVDEFIAMYADAVSNRMGMDGQIIVQYLKSLVDET